MIDQEHIELAIEKTLRGESNLTSGIFSIRGFSSRAIRRLINNLTNTDDDCTYLEAGVLMGGMFVSSFNLNCKSIGFEDFSQFFQADIGDYDKEELEKNIKKNKQRAKEVEMNYGCYFDYDKTLLPNDIDIFNYDGEHGIENQSVALPELFDNMAERFIYMADDANWETTKDGTGVALKFLRNKMWVEKSWHLGKGKSNSKIWVNGIAIHLIKKK